MLDVLEEFRKAEALLQGHFVLSSGLHSPTYLQCARVMMDAGRGALLCEALAIKLGTDITDNVDMVVSPAMGGVVVGYEMGRQISRPAIFFERVEGKFTMRRGFDIPPGARCLMAEDVVTTGLSSRECIEAIEDNGGNTIAACCLVDRSCGKADVGVPLTSLLEIDVPSYPPGELPKELQNIPVTTPGSRKLLRDF